MRGIGGDGGDGGDWGKYPDIFTRTKPNDRDFRLNLYVE
jgi:hypothetical protein